MKKYLMTGIAALAMCAAFTSCSKDTEFEQISESDLLKAEYNAAFIKTFGQPAANQDWGFGTTVTRYADVNSNEWVAKGYNVSKAVTDGERDTVMTYFRTTKNPISETVDIHNFFVLNVGYSDAVYNAKDRNNNKITITNPGQSQMDWIFCGPGTNESNQFGDDHINNLNANSGQIQHMKNSGSEYFGFHDSYGTDHQEGKTEHRYCQVNRNFVLRFIEHGGQVDLYVGLNYESGKSGEGWHINPDEYFSDRVLKLVPGEGNWFDGRVMAEDLSATESTDFDFNDVVFDYKLTSTGATICLLAAGGTLELKIGDEEVHSKFGVSPSTMVNTGVNGSSNVQPVIFTISGSFANANDIPVTVLKKTGWETLEAKRGEPACKINVPTYTRWVDEYVNINKAYNWFDNWVQTAGATDWGHPVMKYVDRDLTNND